MDTYSKILKVGFLWALMIASLSACDRNACQLPSCFCPGTILPPGLTVDDIPQMVMLSFDDAVLLKHKPIFDKIFASDRTNPNGCNIQATFFVCHNWTDYNLVNELWRNGHEIASHTRTHRLPHSFWRYASYGEWESELEGERDDLASLGKVDRNTIRGARVPYLETGGDAQFQVMSDSGYLYDSSMMTGPFVEGGVWPFTLHTPPTTTYCSNRNCPKQSYPDLWEVPLNRWVALDGKSCAMVDVCDRQPRNKEETKAYFMKNFNRHYHGNRAPVGLHMHAPWLTDDDFKIEALVEFIDEVLEEGDVYFITLQQVISWMQNPQRKEQAKYYAPWASCKKSPEVIPTKNRETRVRKTSTQNQPPRRNQRLSFYTRPKRSTTFAPLQFPRAVTSRKPQAGNRAEKAATNHKPTTTLPDSNSNLNSKSISKRGDAIQVKSRSNNGNCNQISFILCVFFAIILFER